MFPDSGQPYPWFVASATKSVIDPIYPLMGLCRPYVTLLPDGKPKVVLGGFYYDEYLEGVAVYFDPNVLKPSYHRELIGLAGNIPLTVSSPTSSFTLATGPFGMNGRLFGSFGKKYARIVTGQGGIITASSYSTSTTLLGLVLYRSRLTVTIMVCISILHHYMICMGLL